MTKIITGFKTKQDVRDTLKWIEDNTEFKWRKGELPTKSYGWEEYFEEYQEKGGFYINYRDSFGYGKVNGSGYGKEQINFKDIIQEFKKGDIVEVGYMDSANWEPRIYLTTIDGARYPYVCVNSNYEDEFKNGEEFLHIMYNQIRPLRKTHTTTINGKDIELSKESFEELKESLLK